ncbi:MAG: MFS transporter [Proteobacteria bacterium]|nr:MFS transporter [Pseudomonadota bacterium]
MKKKHLTPPTTNALYTRQFVTIWIANFFSVASLAAFFLFPLFITDRGGDKADIGILMGVMTLSSVLARPWISQMVDKIGRKKSYFAGALINTIVPAVHILFQGELSGFYIPLVAVRAVHGVGIGLSFTAAITYVSDIIPGERLNEGLGMFGVTALVAMAAGPAIAEPVVRLFGFNAFFLTVSAFGGVGLILQFLLPETFVPSAAAEEDVSFFTVLKSKKVLGVAFLSLFFGAGLAAQGGFVSPYVKHLGLPSISLFFVAYSAAAVLARVFGSKMADRIGEENIIPWSFIVNACGYLSLIFIVDNWHLAGAGFITGCGHGLIFPCLNALAVRDEPAHRRGKVSGTFTGAMDGGMFVGSITLGYIGEWFGFTHIFATVFVVLVTCAVTFLVFLRKAVT